MPRYMAFYGVRVCDDFLFGARTYEFNARGDKSAVREARAEQPRLLYMRNMRKDRLFPLALLLRKPARGTKPIEIPTQQAQRAGKTYS